MYRGESSSQIIQTWQDEVEQNIEAGSSPILELGASSVPAEDLLALLAMQRWRSQRADVSTPLVPGGGTGPQWLAALMGPMPRRVQAPDPVIFYSGANEAEYLMSVAMLQCATKSHYPGAPASSAIPVSYFAPSMQPGKSVSWDVLPFLSLTDAQQASQVGTPGVAGDAYDAATDPLPDWLAWAGLLLALFLVLLAILL